MGNCLCMNFRQRSETDENLDENGEEMEGKQLCSGMR